VGAIAAHTRLNRNLSLICAIAAAVLFPIAAFAGHGGGGGMKGIYQHCSEAHLHRYLAEFDFSYSNRSGLGVEDTERAALIIQQAGGKRLTYRRTNEAQNA
jgi:hypothetical protein